MPLNCLGLISGTHFLVEFGCWSYSTASLYFTQFLRTKMVDTNNQYSFFQRLVLDIIPNFKWPLLVIVIWLLVPEDFGESFSKFAKDNNLKKLGFGTTVMELDPNKKIKEVKTANEKANTAENVAEALKKMSSKSDSEFNRELKELAESLESLTEQSAKIVNQNSKILEN